MPKATDVKPMRIVGAGLVTADIIARRLPNGKLQATDAAYVAGGTVGNVLCHLSKFGWSTFIVGLVGEDEIGSVVRSDFARFGVDTSYLIAAPSVTTRRFGHIISLDENAQPSHEFLSHCPICSAAFGAVPPPHFSQIEASVETTSGATNLFLADRANELTLSMAKYTKEQGGLFLFEPGYISRNREIVEEMLRLADILKYSHELDWGQEGDKLRRFAAYENLKIIIETRGGSGTLFYMGNRRHSLATEPLSFVRDAAGAGDAFTAGFLVGLGQEGLRKLGKLDPSSVERAIQRGQALGALTCLYVGSKGILVALERDQIQRYIDEILANRRIAESGVGDDVVRGSRLSVPLDNGTTCAFCRLNFGTPPESSRGS
jgi:fructokinase